MKKWIRFFLLLILSLMVGFYQERLKISINYLLKEGGRISGYNEMSCEERASGIEKKRRDAPFDYYHNHSTIHWLFNLNASELTLLKWIVTAVSLVAFALLNFLLLRALGVELYYIRILLYVYAALTTIAFSVYCLGYVLGFVNEAYAFSRKILGALQSIVPAMICWPAAAWSRSIKKNQNDE